MAASFYPAASGSLGRKAEIWFNNHVTFGPLDSDASWTALGRTGTRTTRESHLCSSGRSDEICAFRQMAAARIKCQSVPRSKEWLQARLRFHRVSLEVPDIHLHKVSEGCPCKATGKIQQEFPVPSRYGNYSFCSVQG